MAAAKKPTKQQVAQAKARAGGNNPIKVTNSGLKKLGQAAITAATFTPVGRAAKVASTAVKATSAFKKASLAKAAKNYDNALKKAAGTKSPNPYRDVVESVKVLPRKTAPKSGLENRGARLSASERSDRAMDYEWNKLHGRMDARDEIFYTGMRGPKEGAMRDAGKKNLRKSAAVSREARKTVKINSQRNLKKK